ncbi:MAG: tRNA (cytidine(56)-2'-O)-methyltransferase [Candidatus Diapherotrites archaeon]
MPSVIVLRYGHRPKRDERVTTHCCLVARAFGSDGIVIFGPKDEGIIKTIRSVVKRWGGSFSIEFKNSWLEEVKNLKKQGYKIVHLTMYGKPIENEIDKIRENEKIGVIIGSKKVEARVYCESDYNIAITKQPHSEIAALAVFLDWYFDGKELKKEFHGAIIKAGEKKCKQGLS